MIDVQDPPVAKGTKTYIFKLIGDTREREVTCPRMTWSQALEHLVRVELPDFRDTNVRVRFLRTK